MGNAMTVPELLKERIQVAKLVTLIGNALQAGAWRLG